MASAPEDPWAALDLSGSLADATRRLVAEVERRKIVEALKATGGDRVRAAEQLQVPLRFLQSKIKDYRLATPE